MKNSFIDALAEWLEINEQDRPKDFIKYIKDMEWIDYDDPYAEDDEDEIHEIQDMINRYHLADKTDYEIMATILMKVFYLDYLVRSI